MAEQNYKNHIRFYPPHHFVFYPLMLAVLSFAVTQAVLQEHGKLVWIFLSVLSAIITWVAYMMRQHYALTVQNRVVLLELRYRFFATTGERLEMYEGMLSEGQLFALRFAQDDQLLFLIKKAINEELTADAIKRSIENWKPDHNRV
ncbi:DUF6526 family protein [Flavobacterium sp. DG1-102-2]|uniref:DUF6526 family protein n=1 Tax=Flavobacterium sp. DG1-102-2 TaxID=3081663 RepID=UPI00294A12B7|nr:DUF6526 family protein [Flavobacterium sp. DG1-102-2]MDV6168008.1 DUF6526 family protein [Flavobacterium sp. DG1-102-2]